MSMKLTINKTGASMLADSKFKPFEPKQKHAESKDELLEMLKSNFNKSRSEIKNEISIETKVLKK